MTKEIKLNSLTVKLLEVLGNTQPTENQKLLVEKLLLTAAIQHKLSFDGQLTEKEISCLLLAAKGLTSDETAKLLNLKKTTIETHRRKILRKLSCTTLTQAVFEGIRFGVITPKTQDPLF